MAENSNELIFDPFVPRAYLRNRHAMTMAGNFLWRKSDLPEPEACLYRVDQDTQVLCHCHWQTDRRAALTVIVVHGLEGSTDSQYMRGIAEKGMAAGMNVVKTTDEVRP